MKITKMISICFGVIANIKFHPLIQNFINKQYIKFFNIDLNEFYPIHSYKSLNELFTRGLRQNREFNKDDSIFISPIDGKVMHTGNVDNGRALQIKGFSYSVDRLVGESVSSNLSYANLYLSPSNYHRYHSPCNMYVESIAHFKGALLPVHLKSLYKNKNLFVVNERVVLKARDSFGGILYFVAIGALNVGSIHFYIEPRLQHKSRLYTRKFEYKEPIFIKKGEEIGMFKMGSTIVFFASDVDVLKSDCDIRFGEDLFKRKNF